MEVNPNHPTTRAVSDFWHKIAAVLLVKFDSPHAVITVDDLEKLGGSSCITVQELEDGIHLRVVDAATAARMAKQAGGLPT